MIVARENYGSWEYVGMLKGVSKESWFKADCKPGKYVAYVRELSFIS